jgi:hypothetical protein
MVYKNVLCEIVDIMQRLANADKARFRWAAIPHQQRILHYGSALALYGFSTHVFPRWCSH